MTMARDYLDEALGPPRFTVGGVTDGPRRTDIELDGATIEDDPVNNRKILRITGRTLTLDPVTTTSTSPTTVYTYTPRVDGAAVLTAVVMVHVDGQALHVIEAKALVKDANGTTATVVAENATEDFAGVPAEYLVDFAASGGNVLVQVQAPDTDSTKWQVFLQIAESEAGFAEDTGA